MITTTAGPETSSECDLIHLARACRARRDPRRPLERRAEGRRTAILPVRVHFGSADNPLEVRLAWLDDFSEHGLSLVSDEPFDPGQELLVELCANHHPCTGRLEVVHCTPIDERYRIGLRVLQTAEEVVSGQADSVAESEHQESDRQWLSQARLEFARMFQAHRVARETWLQMGSTVGALIERACRQLPSPGDLSEDSGRRRHPRHTADFAAHLVVQASRGWRRLAIQVTDVSEAGLCVLLPHEELDDPAASASIGDCVLHVGLPVMIAIQEPHETLWLPAEIVRCDYNGTTAVTLGMELVTPASLQFFGA